MEREPIELEYGVAGIVSERSKNYEPVFTRGIVIGVTLCILCSVPLLVAAIMNAPAFTVMLMVSLLLAIVAVAVNLFIRVGMVKGSYDKLLQTGDYSPGKKKSGKLVDKISSIYWLLVTAGFLAYSFITNDWEHSWIVWPVAGVSFGVIAVICQLIQKEE